MEFTGKVRRGLERREGTSERGTWAVQPFLFEESVDGRPESVVADVWDEKLRKWLLGNEGATVTITISTRARSYQGKMYNSLVCTEVFHMGKDVLTGLPRAAFRRAD